MGNKNSGGHGILKEMLFSFQSVSPDSDGDAKQILINSYLEYKKINPNIFDDLSIIVDKDDRFGLFHMENHLQWPSSEHDFTSGDGYLNNLTAKQSRELCELLDQHLPKVA